MIHDENPFADATDQRDPVRRFRGRLAAPVTIVTAGFAPDHTGLTVSSLNVVEGDPGVAQIVVGPTSDLWDVSKTSGAFVIHVLEESDRHLAEVFAGLRPSPGGVFAGLELTSTQYGAVIDRLANRAFCRFVDRYELGYSGIVIGEIADVEASGLTDPLVYFRGNYRSLG